LVALIVLSLKTTLLLSQLYLFGTFITEQIDLAHVYCHFCRTDDILRGSHVILVHYAEQLHWLRGSLYLRYQFLLYLFGDPLVDPTYHVLGYF
jgi:hypothetical protein